MAFGLGFALNPAGGMAFTTVLAVAFVLGLLHGVTPDEHTWPITFSYAIGSYSTRGGMKAGFAFSGGFTIQRAFITTLGFLGLAAIYKQYNLNGPIYVIVGAVMAIAGAYILNKKKYLHIPFDVLLGGEAHHSSIAELKHSGRSHPRKIPTKMAFVHGLIAGFGFGAYSSIIVFVLAPKAPGLIYAPLVGLLFGIGTMFMQIIMGGVFANIARIKKLPEAALSRVGRLTAGRTLYYGGALFAIIGILVTLFPAIDSVAISTGIAIPNLDSIDVETVLVLGVVGIIGIGSMIRGFREVLKR